MPSNFSLDTEELERQIEAARTGTTRIDGEAILRRIDAQHPIDIADLARLWFAAVETESLFEAARAARGPQALNLETFSPLYLTNTCDAECRMCGMRRDNRALQRETASPTTVTEQLSLLMQRGMQAVALLTGEYHADNRRWAMGYVNQALRTASRLGFKHVLINVGSIDADEFDTLLAGLPRSADGSLSPIFTMSTFQETYSPRVYAKFMGTSPDNPRADFQRRLINFDRACEAGIRVMNPGVLLGLNPDLAYELTALVRHTRHLLDRGLGVYLSVPRLRRVSGGSSMRAVSDDDFIRFVALLSLAVPSGKIVITTRENKAMQRKLAPIVSVISAGSAAVVPYTHSGARFELDTSQFEVIDQRPFEAILGDHRADGASIANFEPPATNA